MVECKYRGRVIGVLVMAGDKLRYRSRKDGPIYVGLVRYNPDGTFSFAVKSELDSWMRT